MTETDRDKLLALARQSVPDEIDLYRIIRDAGRSNSDKSRAVDAVLEPLRKALRALAETHP